MDAYNFLMEMKATSVKKYSELSAKEYFDTDVGKKMIGIISGKSKSMTKSSFTLQGNETIKEFEKNPLYMGRDFFTDMKELGFICKVISQHDDEAPVKTYLFKAS